MTLTAPPNDEVATTREHADLIELRQRLHAAELQLAQARIATEEARRSKSEFIANISHELRTPLQTILGFSELGASVAHTRAGHGDYADMFRDICAGGERMLGLVNALLDVASVGGSVDPLRLQRVEMLELIGCVVSAAQAQGGGQGGGQGQGQGQGQTFIQPRPAHAQLSFVPPPHSVWARVDADRLQQVLRNVLTNAQRFAAGTSTDITCVDHAVEGITIRVRDHGPGIPDDELEAVFDPFFQSSRTCNGAGGTGLGLTVCRKIMGAHGGSIQAANAPGGGCVISINLPHSTNAHNSAASGTEPRV